jgi:hypothetical protein
LIDKSAALNLSAAAQRNAHASLMEAMYRAEADTLRKARLFNDLGGIADATKFGTDGLAAVAVNLRAMLNVWEETAKRLRATAEDVTEDDMRSLDQAKIRSSLAASRAGWKEVASTSDFFVLKSPVQYDASTPWGQKTKQPS